jgi:para-nitrobenzyl esterase
VLNLKKKSMSQHPTGGQRRNFLKQCGALLGGATLSEIAVAASGRPSQQPHPSALVETAAGKLQGQAQDGCLHFLGVPFAQPPVGALRFASPRAPTPWTGTRDATRYGSAPIQLLDGNVTWIYPPPASISEDCLTLNVWTPGLHGKRPVLVWLYGGAFYSGYNAMPLTDGTRLAKEGDMVVVSVNYRVGILGGAGHPELRDEKSGESANWGLQDQIAALEWVRDNIEFFGGDASRVTVMGQSAGASSAVILGQHPRATHLFHQAVLLSMAYIAAPAQATAVDQATYMNAFAASLNTDVRGLRAIPADKLYQAELGFAHHFGSGTPTGRGRYRWPVLDGSLLSAWPSQRPFADKPTMLGFCRNEGAFAMDLYDTLQQKRLTAPFPTTDEQWRAGGRALLSNEYFLGNGHHSDGSSGRPDADAVLDAFLAASRQDGGAQPPGDTLMALMTDVLYRHNGVRMAQHSAASGNRSVYLYDFAAPLLAPARGTPHTSDIAFWFGSYGDAFYRPKLGAGPFQQAVSRTMRAALSSFVHHGQPTGPGVPAWPALSGEGLPRVLHIGAQGRVAEVSAINDYARLSALDPVYGQPGQSGA